MKRLYLNLFLNFIVNIYKISTRKVLKINFNDSDRTFPINDDFGSLRGTPLDRYYIEKFLSEVRVHITGDILEVGGTKYAQKYKSMESTATALVYGLNTANDMQISADLTNAHSFCGRQFNTFLCTQTYNFIYDIQSAFFTSHKILRDGGYLIGSVASISQISNYDNQQYGDFWRFTSRSLHKILSDSGFSVERLSSYGNVLIAKGFLDGLVAEDFLDAETLNVNDEQYPIVLCFLAKKIQ